LCRKKEKMEEDLRRGGWPTLPIDKEGAAGDLFAPYPATRLRSPREYVAVLSTTAQKQMRCELSNLPLTSEPNYRTTTAHLSSYTACHDSLFTDNRVTDDAGPQISDLG
jgi:hypothetical protein